MSRLRHINFHNLKQLTLAFALLLVCAPAYSQEIEIKNGVNIQASYYNGGRVNMGWELMKEYPEIEAVRIEIEPYRAVQARTWIQEAHENGYQVIATYHDSEQLGTDSREELMNAARWWEKHYDSLSKSGPIIINVMNEWGSHDISSEEYADAYNEAIETIRSVYDGQLIVDVPGFGQATRIAADAYPMFWDKNIRYSVHIYTSAFNVENQRWLSAEDVSYLASSGANCMVGEFCDTSRGGADWCGLIDACYNVGWPLFGWAWNGDGRQMNMVEPRWKDEPLATTFRPTEFLKIIVDKLAGVACYTEADEDCVSEIIGEVCDDGNEYTINDRYNEYCHCTGVFTSDLSTNTSDEKLIVYPNPVSESQNLTVELIKVRTNGYLQIINTMGQSLISIAVFRDQNSAIINTSQLNSGLYWVSFISDKEVRTTNAFVVL